mmetsp:Transcript_47419/g.110803  ORF Transcript_47419/g.110803 Transcript_47419/m.110803 type:complete len:136 (-) Transcript_47419:499-906(-)
MLDYQSLKKEVHDLKDNARQSRETCEVPIDQPESPPTAKQLEKPPQHLNYLNGNESRRLARQLSKKCMAWWHSAQQRKPRSRARKPVQGYTTRWKCTRSGGMDIRQGPYSHTTQEETSQATSGKVSASPWSRSVP